MLGKLLKYEIKATGRIFLPIYLALILLAGINRIFIAFQFFPQNQALSLISGFVSLLYILLICGMFALTFVVMIQRFYKNLLGDEGYLMFTLPVKPSALILSKMLVSFLWIVVSIAVTIVSIFLLTLDPSVITAIATFFQEIADVFLGTHGQQVIIFIIELVVGCIIGIFSSILMVYAAMALGHLFQKHRVLASFGAYLVIMFILQVISTLILSIPTIQWVAEAGTSGTMAVTWVTGCLFPIYIVLDLLYGVGFFLLTKYIFAKKLNLE